MSNDLKPYASMKSSGIEWLGEVPEHWEVSNLGQIGAFSKGRGGSKEDETQSGIPCIRYGDLYTTHRHFIRASRSYVSQKRSSHYTSIKYGDVLFAASGETAEEIGKSAVNLIRSKVCCGGDIILFRPTREISPKFLGYATDSRPTIAQKAVMGRGFTVVHIYSGQLKRLCLALPATILEQNAIARFLDHATLQIERYIRAKEKLIALLEEQKQVMIHDAVTGRIDVRTGKPYPAYKPSGVEWLGEVPAQWEIKKLKYLTKFINGFAFKPSDWRDRGIPIIRIENLNGSTAFNYTDRTNLPKRLLIRPGDIVFAWSGNRGTSFGSFRWDRAFDGYLNQHIFKLAEYTLHREYFFYLLRAVTKHVEDNAHGIIGLVHITKPALGSIAVALASSNEQARIASWLDEQLARIKGAINQTAREIALLKEYRTRLIADVVTGKLDVREAAANLPELEVIAKDGDKTIPAEPDSQQSNTTLHPPATPGASS